MTIREVLLASLLTCGTVPTETAPQQGLAESEAREFTDREARNPELASFEGGSELNTVVGIIVYLGIILGFILLFALAPVRKA